MFVLQRNKLFVTIILIALIALIPISIAFAINPVFPVPKERIGPAALPAGSSLKGQMLHENGEYHLHISGMNADDWRDIVTDFGGHQDLETKEIYVTPCPGAKYVTIYACEGGNDTTAGDISDESIEEYFNQEELFASPLDIEDPDGIEWYKELFFTSIATYIKREQTVSMYRRSARVCYAFRWYDENKNPIRDEKMFIRVTYADRAPVKISPQLVPVERLPKGTGIEAENGKLTCNLPYGTVGYSVSITAPNDATSCNVNSPRTDYEITVPVNNGCIEVSIYSREFDTTAELTLSWQLSTGAEVREMLDVLTIVEGKKDVVSGYVPAKIVNINKEGDSSVLGNITYDNGIVTWRYNDKVMASNALDDARIVYQIDAPHDAAYALVYSLEAFNISAALKDNYNSPDSLNWNWANKRPVKGNKLVDEYWPFIADNTNSKVTVYHSSIFEGAGYGRGLVNFAIWFDANDNRLYGTGYEPFYWCSTSEDVYITRTGKNLTKSGFPNGTVSESSFEDDENLNYTLESLYRPQFGQNAYHIELTLINENKQPVQPEENTIFYLPYPEGIGPDSNYTYQLEHYDPAFVEVIDRPEVTQTEFGLRFVSNTLSPFVLSWEKQEAHPEEPIVTPSVPKTGDDFPLSICFMLFAASLLALTALIRRARNTDNRSN